VGRQLTRRTALGLSTGAAVAAVFGSGTAALAQSVTAGKRNELAPDTPAGVRSAVKAVYDAATATAGGMWESYISVANADGTTAPTVDQSSAEVVQAYSVNKLGVATAILDKVDKGSLELTQTVEVTRDIIIPDGDGIFRLDHAYPSTVTLGHVLAALLTVSDDTAVRLCGLVTTSSEINRILTAKGFRHTQVQPTANPHRFYLGTTTPHEMHSLLQTLVTGTLLSASSTTYMLGLLRSPIAFTDGIRRIMSSGERARIATKAGWFADGRNEAGVIFSPAGKAVLTYSIFAHGQADAGNFGATHPAVQARAVIGRAFLDAVDSLEGSAAIGKVFDPLPYRPVNGG